MTISGEIPPEDVLGLMQGLVPAKQRDVFADALDALVRPSTLPMSNDCYVCWPEHHSGEHYGCTGCLEVCVEHADAPGLSMR